MTHQERCSWAQESKQRILDVCNLLLSRKKQVPQRQIAKLATIREGLLSSYCAKYPEVEQAVAKVRRVSSYEKAKARLFEAINYFKEKGQKVTKKQVRRKARVPRVTAYRCYHLCPSLRRAYLEIKPENVYERCDRLINNALERNIAIRRSHALANGISSTSFYARRNRDRPTRDRIQKLRNIASSVSKIVIVAHYLRGRGETVGQYEFAFLARMSPDALWHYLHKKDDGVRKIVHGTIKERTRRKTAEWKKLRTIRLEVYRREIAELVKNSKLVAEILSRAA